VQMVPAAPPLKEQRPAAKVPEWMLAPSAHERR